MANGTGLKTTIAAIIAGIICAVAPAPAQESPDEATLSLTYNEEVVRKLLNESDPDVAFLARLKMMRGHLSAALSTAAAGDAAAAREHIKHPSTEILPEINDALASHGLANLVPALDAAVEKLGAGADGAETQAAVDYALKEIARGEAMIDPAKLRASGIAPDVIVLLLRTAVVEYNEAFEYGKIVNLVEYHDGAAFIAEARKLLEAIEPALAARDPKSLEKVLQSYTTLEAAWPGHAPPEKSVLPVSKMLALVTIIELNLNRMRGGA